MKPFEYHEILLSSQGSVAQWITRLTTNQEIAGSTPARVDVTFFYNFGCSLETNLGIANFLVNKYFDNY